MYDIILPIAKKEFLDNVRNKWVILLSLLFIILTCVTSYFGSTGKPGWHALHDTIRLIASPINLLIPIIGLMLGYATIAGEREKGSLHLLTVYSPVRSQIIIGKFIGLATVLLTAMLIGFSMSGIIIGLNAGWAGWPSYLLFVIESFLLGCTFLSISILLSSFFKTRSKAMGATIFIWFLFTIIWSMIIAGLLLATFSMEDSLGETLPHWFYISDFFNPSRIFSSIILMITSTSHNQLPWYYNIYSLNLATFVWITVCIVLSTIIFKKMDI
ncbi:MAG: ABC transporter permease [Thermoplasmata archaeon]|nr:ABC transporter permease [Thermoplasmata archaeon]